MASEYSPVRMIDVARQCGVAESTVSHVLNGTKAVSEKTKAKILKAVQELNYHRDSDARRLARGKSNFLGLVISDIENPFYPGVINAFEEAAYQNGYEVLLCATNYSPERTEAIFRQMIENKVPGAAVLTSRVDPKMSQHLRNHGVASVFLDSGGPERMKSEIVINYQSGMRAAANYLSRLGHRKFGLIAGPQQRASHRAFKEACEEAIQAVRGELHVLEEGNNADGGANAINKLQSETSLPSAIFCSNDLTAMGAMRSLKNFGIRVPQDISIIGADDIPFAELIEPPLTTIRIPRAAMGREAFQLLKEMLDTESSIPRQVILGTELVLRQSTSKAPGNPL